MSSGETLPLQEEKRSSSSFIIVHITAIARTWGLITVAVMWASAIFMINDHERGFIVYYLVIAAVLVSFLEITWVLNKCACCGHEGCCCRIWRAVMWIDNWKKFLLYVGLSVPLFLQGKAEALCIISGFLMIILSTMYLVKTFQGQATVSSYKRLEQVQLKKTNIVTHEIWTQTEVEEHPTSPSYLERSFPTES